VGNETPALTASTMERLNDVKRVSPSGVDYWRARDIHSILGYATFAKFEGVMTRVRDALAQMGEEPQDHVARTGKMVAIGSGAQRKATDYYLTRAACYLAAMNGDPSKQEVAQAQRYFASRTRQAEISDQQAADFKRLQDRDRISKAVKRVNDAAKDVGVTRYGIFTAAGAMAFYDLSADQVANMKGLPAGEKLFDRAGTLELAGNAFRMELAAERLSKEGVSGEDRAVRVNREVGKTVRETMKQQLGHGPEHLPLEAEPIRAVEARLLGRGNYKTLPGS
jgi:DNA-damage-inducible protein D